MCKPPGFAINVARIWRLTKHIRLNQLTCQFVPNALIERVSLYATHNLHRRMQQCLKWNSALGFLCVWKSQKCDTDDDGDDLKCIRERKRKGNQPECIYYARRSQPRALSSSTADVASSYFPPLGFTCKSTN